MRKDYEIVGSYDNQRVSTISAERTVNLFEYSDPDGKRPKTLLPTSGLTNTNLNFLPETGGSRATFVFQGVIYQVFGGSVFRITGPTGSLSYSKIGQLPTFTGYVGIDANTFQVTFVDGQEGWVWDTKANTFTQITDTSFPAKPIDICYLDGFTVVANGDTNNFQLSMFDQSMVWGGGVTPEEVKADFTTDLITLTSGSTVNYQTGTPFIITSTGTVPSPLNPGSVITTYYAIRVDSSTLRVALTYDDAIANLYVDLLNDGTPTITIESTGQLQLGSITTHPGTIVGCRTLHRLLFLFSQNYTEVWENAGAGTTLPFRRNNTMLMEVGTPAVGSIVVGFDRMFFLSQDRDGLGSVMEVKGSEAIPVSNRALDFQLAQYAANPAQGVADCRGVLIKENGLIFYRMNFTLADHTFVLNVSMSMVTDDPSNSQIMWHEEEVLDHSRHPAQTHGYYKGVNYYGDYAKAKLYVVDNSVSTNDGESIRRMRIAKSFAPEGYDRLRIDRFHLDLLQGAVDEEVTDEEFIEAEDGDDIITEDSQLILTEQQIIISTGEPVVFFSYSKDGGQTYGNIIQAPMGQIGERTFRTVWRKLGVVPRGQAFTPKIEFFNQIPFVVLGAAWDFEVMPE